MDSSENAERTVEETIALLSKWFTDVCKFVPLLANQLSSELVNEGGITEVEQFSMVQQIDPNWLDSLKCQLPTLAKMLVKANVEKIGRTQLRHLDLEDVRGVVDACLPEFPYGTIFKEKEISGFTLTGVKTAHALVEFGVTNTIHATALFASINEWNRIGVPNELIAENTLRNVHIKEEVFREMNRTITSSQNALTLTSIADAPEPASATSTDTNATPASTAAKKAPTSQKAEPSYVGMGTPSNPVCFSSSASEAGSDDEDEEEMEMEIEDEKSVHTTQSLHSLHSLHSNHSSHTACTTHSAAPPTPVALQPAQQDAANTSNQPVVDHTAEPADDFGADGPAEHTDDDNDEHMVSVSTFNHAAVDDMPQKAASADAQAQDIRDQNPSHEDINTNPPDSLSNGGNRDRHQNHHSQDHNHEQTMDLTIDEVQDLTGEEEGAHVTGHKRTHSADNTAGAAGTTTSNANGNTRPGGEANQAPSKRAKRTKTPSPRFPGIPLDAAFRVQYAAIFEAIEATRPGKVIRLSKEHIQLLLDTPRSLIQGHWEFQDMSYQPSHGHLSSGQRKQNELRGTALVFVPTSLQRAEAMVSPGRELIFVESSKKRSKTEWRRPGQETAAASSGDSSNEEDAPLGEEHLYGCRVRPGAHASLPPKGLSHAPVTQFLPEPEIEDFIYTRPFPGIPQNNGASPRRYAEIIDAIEASRAGKVIRVSRADIETLLLTPAEEVGGHWEFQNRWPLPEDCELSLTLKRQSVMLKHTLVFVPDSSSSNQRNAISMRGAPPRELVFVESIKKPSQRNSRREDQSATSGDSEPEVEGARRQYGTVVAVPEGQSRQSHQSHQSQQTQVVTHSDVALASAVYGDVAPGDRRQNYAEHFNYGPYPGIPLHEELQQQYRPIVEKIEATRVGDDVFCTEEEVAMLLTLPEEFVGGIWMRADRSQSRATSARIAAKESAVNALRANTVVFFPSAAPEPGSLEDTRIVIVELKNSTQSFPASPALHISRQDTESSITAQPTSPLKPVTYGELYGDRPFPGIPQHPLVQAQYDDIVDRIRRTQVGEAVLVTENQRDMLRAMPAPLVNEGRWVQQDTSYHLGRASNDTKDNERRTKSLVFIPGSAAPPAEVPLAERANPASADNIVIVTSAPKKVKTKSIEVVEPVKKKAPAKAATKTVTKPAAVAVTVAKAAPKAAAAKSAKIGAKAPAVKVETASKAPTVYNVYSDSDSEDSENGATGQASTHSVKREVSSDEDGANQSGRPRRKSVTAAVRVTQPASAGKAPRRHSSAHETQSVSARSVTSAATGRHSLGSAGSGGGGVLAFREAVRKACHDANHSRDDKTISDAVKYLGDAAAKNDPYAVDLMLSTDTYRRLMFFVSIAPKLNQDRSNFIYRSLKAITTIITRLDGFPQIELIFEYKYFGDILEQCLSTNGDVRQQALVLVSDIGVTDEGDIKQKVLSAGAVKTIIKSFYSVQCFSSATTRLRAQGHCARCLYKLASSSTPRQFEYFVPALGLLREVLLSDTISWEFVIEAAQAVNFFVVPNRSRQIDVLMEHNFFDILVEMFADNNRVVGLRWHASLFIWSIAKYCDNAQMRKMFRLMGVLGNVFHLDHAHPHLRAAALNIMQVMLQRGESVIQQFVYHRDGIPANAMALVRDHQHQQLVHSIKRSSNCIIKYASFTLAHAVAGANSEQLIRLLELGVYPLLFKIVSFEGEEAQPEEAKGKAVSALSHLLQEVPNEVKHYQLREEREKCVDFSIKWNLIRALVTDRYEAHSDDEGEEGGSSAAEESKTNGLGDFVWTAELREKAQELLEMARETELVP